MAKLTQEELWEMIGFIKISPARYKTIKTLEGEYLMPSEIARKTGMQTTQVSNALYDLKRKKLVVCLNEKSHKGRIYQNTPLAIEILNMLENKQS
ncbi:MarR family transcriptional regulator [uncultured Methanobrevibacter sp.]|uniref:MarR family transcriptional regulator n=1 Tax=uncultured Methanobrevibacter sp. TaxID=253161 RepID=UPI0026376C77|nr:MarR family transcriptional regulator [uncultured Methanobrevibacter sp.]